MNQPANMPFHRLPGGKVLILGGLLDLREQSHFVPMNDRAKRKVWREVNEDRVVPGQRKTCSWEGVAEPWESA